jgi:hypothetical protein
MLPFFVFFGIEKYKVAFLFSWQESEIRWAALSGVSA